MRKILGLGLVVMLGVAAVIMMQTRTAVVTSVDAKETNVAVSDPENTLVMELATGNVLIELSPGIYGTDGRPHGNGDQRIREKP